MKKIIKTSVISILLIGLLINSAYAVYDWGIDDDGKFSYSKVMVFIKEEYTNDPETVINNIKRKYDVISAEVISDIKDPEHPLILLVKLPVSDEDFFIQHIIPFHKISMLSWFSKCIMLVQTNLIWEM